MNKNKIQTKDQQQNQINNQAIEHLKNQLQYFPKYNLIEYLSLMDKYSGNQISVFQNMFPWGWKTQNQKKLNYQNPKIRYRYLKYNSFQNIWMSIKYGIASCFCTQMTDLKCVYEQSEQLYLVMVAKNHIFGIVKVEDIDFHKSFKYWKAIQKKQIGHNLENGLINLVGIIKIKWYNIGTIDISNMDRSLVNIKQDISKQMIKQILQYLPKCPLHFNLFLQGDQQQIKNRQIQIKLILQNKLDQIQKTYKIKTKNLQTLFFKKNKSKKQY